MGDVNLLMKAMVRATPAECTRAMMDEIEGRSHWWHPYLLLRHRPATPLDALGCVVDVLASARGRTDRRWGTTHWAMLLEDFDPGRSMRWKFLGGHYRGWMAWEFTLWEPGITEVSVCGVLRPAGWNRLRSAVCDEIFEVTNLLRRGFDGMEQHLVASPSPDVSAPDMSAAHRRSAH